MITYASFNESFKITWWGVSNTLIRKVHTFPLSFPFSSFILEYSNAQTDILGRNADSNGNQLGYGDFKGAFYDTNLKTYTNYLSNETSETWWYGTCRYFVVDRNGGRRVDLRELGAWLYTSWCAPPRSTNHNLSLLTKQRLGECWCQSLPIASSIPCCSNYQLIIGKLYIFKHGGVINLHSFHSKLIQMCLGQTADLVKSHGIAFFLAKCLTLSGTQKLPHLVSKYFVRDFVK